MVASPCHSDADRTWPLGAVLSAGGRGIDELVPEPPGEAALRGLSALSPLMGANTPRSPQAFP